MLLKLQILFTVLSALCLAAIIPVAVWGGWIWFGVVGGCALLFFFLMKLCKQENEIKQQNQPSSTSTEKTEKPDEAQE